MRTADLLNVALVLGAVACMYAFYTWTLKQEELTECYLVMAKTELKERGLE